MHHQNLFPQENSDMAQNTVFHQIIKLIPRTHFQTLVHQYEGDKKVRTLDCWTWFGALLFGQLTGHDSIRAIERTFSNSDLRIKKLGFGTVRKSTLSDANKTRPHAILEDLFKYLLRRAQQAAPRKSAFRFQGKVLALDSSSIELSLKLCPWAQVHKDLSAEKLHTAIDVANYLPEIVVLSEGRQSDLTVAKNHFHFAKGTTVLMDRGYMSYEWMRRLDEQGVFFVTRAMSHFKFKVSKSQPVDRTRGHICDQIVYVHQRQGTAKTKRYIKKMRRISYRDPDSGRKFVFLTNRFDLATQTICDLYKARWKVELFFKTLKQNLKIRKFLGNSAHAVKAQIWVALIAYLLIQLIRFSFKTKISVPDTIAVIGVLLLLKEPISRILKDLPCVTRHPPPFQLTLPI